MRGYLLTKQKERRRPSHLPCLARCYAREPLCLAHVSTSHAVGRRRNKKQKCFLFFSPCAPSRRLPPHHCFLFLLRAAAGITGGCESHLLVLVYIHFLSTSASTVLSFSCSIVVSTAACHMPPGTCWQQSPRSLPCAANPGSIPGGRVRLIVFFFSCDPFFFFGRFSTVHNALCAGQSGGGCAADA